VLAAGELMRVSSSSLSSSYLCLFSELTTINSNILAAKKTQWSLTGYPCNLVDYYVQNRKVKQHRYEVC